MISLLDPDAPVFPDPARAIISPDGLLAVGGNLRPASLLRAYALGIFPWYEEGQPLLWWSPDPRCVLHPAEIHVSRSLRKILRRGQFTITFDRQFDQVIRQCAHQRNRTWLTGPMVQAYQALHHLGYAHSVEVWRDNRLAGGLYGLALGQFFFGESMFSTTANASKVAFVALGKLLDDCGFELIDCQVESAHLQSMGARLIPRAEFLSIISPLKQMKTMDSAWKSETTTHPSKP